MNGHCPCSHSLWITVWMVSNALPVEMIYMPALLSNDVVISPLFSQYKMYVYWLKKKKLKYIVFLCVLWKWPSAVLAIAKLFQDILQICMPSYYFSSQDVVLCIEPESKLVFRAQWKWLPIGELFSRSISHFMPGFLDSPRWSGDLPLEITFFHPAIYLLFSSIVW